MVIWYNYDCLWQHCEDLFTEPCLHFISVGLEDKATACQMLVCYARELKEHFVEYAEQTVRLMVPMLKFYFHDGVRAAAAESLPCLIECAKIRGPQYVQEMWAYICPELIKVRMFESFFS